MYIKNSDTAEVFKNLSQDKKAKSWPKTTTTTGLTSATT